MSKLLRLLLAYLHLGVDGETDPPEQEAGTGDETLDDLLDTVEPETTAIEPEKVDAAAVKEARRRLQEKEDELETERAARRAAESRAAAIPTRKDPLYEQEEAELNAARAAGESLKVWQIESNRAMRANKQESTAALFEARDVADKTKFDRLEATHPGVYKRYSDKVEKKVSEFRAQGNLIPRSEVLKWMIGEDALTGTIQPKTKTTKTDAPTKVDRGRMPGTRSDTSGKGSPSEREKRRERLRSTFI